MRIGDRKQGEINQEQVYDKLHNEINVHSSLYDTVILVNPFDLAVLSVVNNKLNREVGTCYNRCPLCKDACGCICKEVLSTMETKMRFTFNKTTAYMVICKPIITKYRNYVLVLIKCLDPSFSFGSYSDDEAVEQITKLSSHLVLDALTKIFNRSYITSNIDYQIQEAMRLNEPLSLACIDIDNFKKFNDTYGHEFGDKVLIAVANCMKKSIHGVEKAYPVRIGGDEFIVVGVGVSKSRFKMLMTKLCQLVESTKLPYGNEMVGIKISIGVSEILEDRLSNYKELYNKADEQLYIAKEAGKGCVR